MKFNHFLATSLFFVNSLFDPDPTSLNVQNIDTNYKVPPHSGCIISQYDALNDLGEILDSQVHESLKTLQKHRTKFVIDVGQQCLEDYDAAYDNNIGVLEEGIADLESQLNRHEDIRDSLYTVELIRGTTNLDAEGIYQELRSNITKLEKGISVGNKILQEHLNYKEDLNGDKMGYDALIKDLKREYLD